MTMQNVSNLYCPGCAPGNFAQPHICGLGRQILPNVFPGPPFELRTAPRRDPSVLDLMGRATDMIIAGRLTRAAFRELFFDETPEEADATLKRIDAEQR